MYKLLVSFSLVVFSLVLVLSSIAWAQNVVDQVLLVERASGIPGHPEPGETK